MKHNHTTCALFCLAAAISFCSAKLFSQEAAPSAPGWQDDGTVVRLKTSTDNVGIGTTTPNRKLTLANTTGVLNYMNIKDGTRELLLGVENNAGIISMMSNHDLIFRGGLNTERMRITVDGNIGIGMAEPSEVLDVFGNIHASGKIRASAYASNSPLIFEAPIGTERMRIDDVSGFVGIGEDAPAATLDVKGNVGPVLRLHHVGSSGDFPTITFQDHFIEKGRIWADNFGFAPRLHLSTSSAEPTLVLFGADVGIGTDIPGVKLEVAGTDDPLVRINNTGDLGNAAIHLQHNGTTRAYLWAGNEFLNTGRLNLGTDFDPATIQIWNGQVGIGRDPSFDLDVVGTTHCGSLNQSFTALLADGNVVVHGHFEADSYDQDVIPGFDDIWHLGNSSHRWQEVWATNGSIQTSDAREKENVQGISYGLDDVMQLRPVSFTWRGKPEEGTKLGLIADQQKAMTQQNELLDGILETLEENGMHLKKIKARADEDAGIQEGVILQKSGTVSMIESLPETYSLSVNYPNPFNPTTTVQYVLPQAGNVTIEVYNTLGQKVQTLMDEFQSAGYHSIQWDGKNQIGEAVASGTYLYKMQSGNFVQTQKMLLAK